MKQMKFENKGMLTVEAALVMPVVLAVISLIYILSIIQYNNIVARAEAMRVVNRVAANWNAIGGDQNNILTESLKAAAYTSETAKNESDPAPTGKERTGKNVFSSESFTEHNPYRFFVEIFTAGSKKKTNMSNYLKKQMENLADVKTGVKMESNVSEIKSDGSYNIFNRSVSVTIKNMYDNPVFSLLDGMGLHMDKTYDVTASARLTEPADFIRNVTYIQDFIRDKKGEKGRKEPEED